MQTLTLRHELIIHAHTAKLWEVLTSAEYTEQFLVEGRIACDWTEGEPIFLIQEQGLLNQVSTIGKVRDVNPGTSLSFSLSSVNEFIREPVVFHYELFAAADSTRLILLQEVALAAEDFRLLNEHGKAMLQKIKWLAEYS